jgi:SAM-dependent methyltransferase
MKGGNPRATARGLREIAHGKLLAQGDTEMLWGWTSPAGQQRFKRRAELILSSAAIRPGQKVLELGCGTGMFTDVFRHSRATIHALDISPDLLQRARARIQAAENVIFIVGEFESSNVDSPFDAIIGSSVLHHLDIERAVARCLLLLKPGGRIAFAEPNMLNPQVFIERALRFVPPFSRYTSPDETAFIRFRLCAVLERAGFEDVRIRPFDFLHPATPAACIPVVSALGRMLERTPGVREISGSLLISCRKR